MIRCDSGADSKVWMREDKMDIIFMDDVPRCMVLRGIFSEKYPNNTKISENSSVKPAMQKIHRAKGLRIWKRRK